MNLLPREIEERYGAARGLLIPAIVTPSQLDILRAEEKRANSIWQIPLLLYAGARLVCHVQPSSGYLRPLQFTLPNTILDLEDFDNALKDAALTEFGVEIELGHYLLMTQITFISNNPDGGDEASTTSRTLHLFTGHVRNMDEFINQAASDPDRVVRLSKPAELNASLQAEWNEVKARQFSATPNNKPKLVQEYHDAWVFVYARLMAQAFQQLFGWDLPQL